MAFCQECGNSLPLRTRFCDQCGAPVPRRPGLPLLAGVIGALALVGIVTVLLVARGAGSRPDHRSGPTVAAGHGLSVAVMPDGTVLTWGTLDPYLLERHYSGHGQLSPARVGGLTDVMAVSVGWSHSLALRRDGTVWAWGYTDSYDRVTSPERVRGLTDVVAVAAGSQHGLALRRDGTVWAWEFEFDFDEDGPVWDTPPVQVQGLADVIAVSAGMMHSLALRRDGTVCAWGWSEDGQLGDGSTTDRPTPVQVQGLTDVVAVSAGLVHSLALRRDGTVWIWGVTEWSQQGGEVSPQRTVNTPVQVQGLTDVVAVSARLVHSLALRRDGTVWIWGVTVLSRQGGEVSPQRIVNTPERVHGLTGVSAVAAGGMHSLAVRRDGSVWAWGENLWGQLGDGTTTTRLTPVQVKLK